MLVLATIWWLFFWTVFGLCIGSFLNVVIYRLPRNQSLRDPLWSACPACGQRIAWYDNLPVISYVLLRARCRHCRSPISARYPIVEMLTALVVVALFDAFFVARTRGGLLNEPFLTWALSQDWPIFLAHVVLFACLLAMAAIDLQEYWLDIRFTTVATWFGFALHALWTPQHHTEWLGPHDATAIGAFGALAGLGGLWIWLRVRAGGTTETQPDTIALPPGTLTDESRYPGAPGAPDAAGVAGPGTAAPAVGQPSPMPSTLPLVVEPSPEAALPAIEQSSRLGVVPLLGAVAVGAALLGTVAALGTADLAGGGVQPAPWRALVPPILVFLLILNEGRVRRPADSEVILAIEAERLSARRMVLGEVGLLLPAVLLGIGGAWVQLADGAAAHRLADLLHYRASGTWEPLYGLATAATGFVIGGAIGWAVRIVFTLAFGKEALGIGDVHVMAAAGCVAGWPVVLLGFLLAVFFALFAWLLTVPFKRSRAIPLIPWLALGYLVAVVQYEALLAFPPIRNALEVVNMLILTNSPSGTPGGPP